MGDGTKYWPTEHERDVWDAPPVVLLPSLTMSTTEAAQELGISRYLLIRHLDGLGLTVYRRPTDKRRYFSRKEVAELKARSQEVPLEEVVKAKRRGRDYARLFVGKKRFK